MKEIKPHIAIFSTSNEMQDTVKMKLKNQNVQVFSRPHDIIQHIKDNHGKIMAIVTSFEHHVRPIQLNIVLEPGKEVIQAARKHNLPVIAIGMQNEKQPALNSGANAFVEIPDRHRQLVEAVRQHTRIVEE
jgi:CheY-like chemotaxis protein